MMKATKIICAMAAASLAFSSAAIAQGNPANTERAQSDATQRDGARHNGQSGAPSRAAANSHESRDGRGAGPEHSFYKGGRLPAEYRNRQYAVDDWRGHHLSAPPRGYHWVQAGDDYVLAAIATGVIASILLSNH